MPIFSRLHIRLQHIQLVVDQLRRFAHGFFRGAVFQQHALQALADQAFHQAPLRDARAPRRAAVRRLGDERRLARVAGCAEAGQPSTNPYVPLRGGIQFIADAHQPHAIAAAGKGERHRVV
jgi:hypothetical protein